MKSTSIHTLNADNGLSKLNKLVYLFLNWVNNLFPFSNVDSRIAFHKFVPTNLDGEWEKTYKDSSAARKLSDIYWRSLPWKEISQELGGEIHVFDTGCGHGNYGVRIEEGSGGLLTSYTGVDAKRRPNWSELEKKFPKFHFIESSSDDILPFIPRETNLFITQSAIEHFDEDVLFFERLREFVDKQNRPVMQIHLFPGKATLPLYLFHGLRQYTPRTISKITRLFDKVEDVSLCGLGGRSCAKVHFKYFTWPVLITRKYPKATFDTALYDKELKNAILEDLKSQPRSPLFWALTIRHKPSA